MGHINIYYGIYLDSSDYEQFAENVVSKEDELATKFGATYYENDNHTMIEFDRFFFAPEDLQKLDFIDEHDVEKIKDFEEKYGLKILAIRFHKDY